MKILFAFILAISLNSFAQTMPAAQFKNGQNISIKEKSGEVTYYCRNEVGNNFTKHYYCYSAQVNPGTHDYFVSNIPMDADNVTLTGVHADGSKKTKNVAFNSEKSSTTFQVNLLVRSLTQSPLLKVGANDVSYKFTKKNKTVAEGAFPFQVDVLESKQCRPRNAFGTNNECQFESFGCDNYFWLEQDCN